MLRLPAFTPSFPTTVTEAVRLKAAARGGSVVCGWRHRPVSQHEAAATDTAPCDRHPSSARVGRAGSGKGRATENWIGRDSHAADSPSVGAAAVAGPDSSRGHDIHPHPSEHGNGGWEPAARHPLQLLRPDLRVAAGDRLLHEEGWQDLLGGSLQSPLLGGTVERSCAGDGGARCQRDTHGTEGKPHHPGRRALPERWHRLSHQAGRRAADAHRGASAPERYAPTTRSFGAGVLSIFRCWAWPHGWISIRRAWFVGQGSWLVRLDPGRWRARRRRKS